MCVFEERALTSGQCVSHGMGWHCTLCRRVLLSIIAVQLHFSHGDPVTWSPTYSDRFEEVGKFL